MVKDYKQALKEKEAEKDRLEKEVKRMQQQQQQQQVSEVFRLLFVIIENSFMYLL